MTKVKAKETNDEVVTPTALARAIELGRTRRKSAPMAKSVCYLAEFESLAVRFADKVAILFPVKKYAEFARLNLSQLGRITIGFGGSALCLDEQDLHVSIAGMMSASQPLMALATTIIASKNGSRRSQIKASSSRENGKKGGRPRKLALKEQANRANGESV
jgi:hypothetical protein